MTYLVFMSGFCRKMDKPINPRPESGAGVSYLNVMIPWKQFYSTTPWNKFPINKNDIDDRIPLQESDLALG